MLALDCILNLRKKFWINTLSSILVQLLHYILKCNYFGISISDEEWFSETYVGRTASYFVEIIWCKLYDVPVGFVTPPPHLRQCIAMFAVAEGRLLLDIGRFVLFSWYRTKKTQL